MKLIKNSLYINCLFFFINLILYFFVFKNLDVNKFYLSLFYFTSFFLVFYSFNYKTIFFEKFLSLFIWLGFPFKLAIPYVLLSMGYHDAKLFPEIPSVNNFSIEVYNDAIVFSLFGVLGLILASILRKKYIFSYSQRSNFIKNNLSIFFEKNKTKILSFFLILVFLVNFSNLYFEIYQKGLVSNFSPKILVLIFKWLLLMGLSSFACYFVYYEFEKKNYTIASNIFLFESFFSNITILSRAFVFNVSILIFLFFEHIKYNIKIKRPLILFLATLSLLLIFLNINFVSKLRSCVTNYQDISKSEKIFLSKKCLSDKEQKKALNKKLSTTVNKISSLSVSRWVGIDSMMVIMNKKKDLNFNFYLFFLKEKKSSNEKSYYEQLFLNKRIVQDGKIKTNHVILPGFISYQAISGSIFFVFWSCFLLGIVGAYIEKFSYKLSFNNFVLTAFISYLFVFRMVHFGYLPTNTLIYCLSIVFTVLQFRIYEFMLSKLKIVK